MNKLYSDSYSEAKDFAYFSEFILKVLVVQNKILIFAAKF